MKQVLQAIRGGSTRLADVPEPTLRPGGVLVRTRRSLISAGTEKMIIDLASKSLVGKARERPDLVKKLIEKTRREGIPATFRGVMGRLSGDLPLGYSAAGEVIEVAEDVTGIKVGDRVACAGAGYANHAEFIYVPRNLCARVPEGVSLKHACTSTLGAIAMQGVRVADLRLGETAVVIGLGLLGQLTVQMLRASGVRVVGVDMDSERAALAGRLGAEVALGAGQDPEPVVLGMTSGHGADAVVVCAATKSNGPLDLAGQLCRKRGIVSMVGAVGMEVDRRSFYAKELQLRMSTSYGPGRYDTSYEEKGLDYPYPYVRWTEGRNLESFLQLIAQGDVDVEPLLTHEYEIERAEEAYELVTGKREERFLGIVLTYDGEPRRSVIPAGAPARAAGGNARLGVIGAGQFATAVLLPYLRNVPKGSLQAVATAAGSSAASAARAFGISRVAESADAVLAADDVDGVAVLTRHDTHADLVSRALEAGKACFVEKPLAITREGLARVVATMQTHPGLVCVGFNRRFAPGIAALRKELASRTSPCHARYRVNAGAIPAGHWTRDPEIGGGRILGEGCHFVDLLAYIVGSRVLRVQAEQVGDDGAAALLRFEDGSTAALEYVTAGAPSIPKEWIEVHWEGTSWVLDDFREVVRHTRSKPRKVWSGAQDKGHQAELAAWVAAVADGKTSPVPFDQAVDSTLATFAVVESIATGRAVDLGA